jgi:hypothetical protein
MTVPMAPMTSKIIHKPVALPFPATKTKRIQSSLHPALYLTVGKLVKGTRNNVIIF